MIVNVNLTPSATGILKTEIEFKSEPNKDNITTSQAVTLEVNADVTFGNKTKIGDNVEVHYAGILAKDSKLFDSSMEYVWNTYPYYNYGVSELNVHTATLPANNIGCFFESTKDGVKLSYVDPSFSAYEGGLRVGMEIHKFNNQDINTYEEFYDAINATLYNETILVSVVNGTAGIDNYTVTMMDLGKFYSEYYPAYYQSWMDGKGFMGINAEEKTALNSDNCAGSRVMIVGFDNRMVGMYEGQTLAVRIPAKDAYGETGYSALAGEDLVFLVKMVEIVESEVIEPEIIAEDSNSCFSGADTTSLVPRVSEHTVPQEVDGEMVDRRFLIQTPAEIDSSKCYPLVFVLHGNGGMPDGYVGQFRDIIDSGEFIGIYPEGVERSWNLGQEASTANDTEFIESVADYLYSYSNINHDRRYVIGFSNGAGMAQTLGKESNYFSAFVAVVTSLTTENMPTNQSRTISVMQILGEDDDSVPYEGGEGVNGHVFLSGDESARIWAEHNGCDSAGQNTTLSDGSIRTIYSNCVDGGEVINYKVANAGHQIDHSFEGGLNTLMWNFLSSH